MIWIEAIMAFAVTMMAFSTIVSMIVEMLHRILRLREAKLKMMLDQVYTRLIHPQVGGLMGEAGRTGRDFAESMTDPDFIPEAPGKRPFHILLHWFLNPKNTKTMAVLEFIEKFARTKEGRALLQKGRQKGDLYLKRYLEDLVSQYERFEESAREYFTRRARFFSIIIAMGLAVSININPIEIFKAYLDNTNLRNNIVSQGEIIGEQMETQAQRLAALAGDGNMNKTRLRDLEAAYGDIRASLDGLQETGIPFGWGTPGMEKVWKAWNQDGGLLSMTSLNWFFSVVLGGLLIGLGGPFWFDLFKKMSLFAGLARSMSPKAGPQEDKADTVSVPPGAVEKSDPLALFKRAAWLAEKMAEETGAVGSEKTDE